MICELRAGAVIARRLKGDAAISGSSAVKQPRLDLMRLPRQFAWQNFSRKELPAWIVIATASVTIHSTPLSLSLRGDRRSTWQSPEARTHKDFTVNVLRSPRFARDDESGGRVNGYCPRSNVFMTFLQDFRDCHVVLLRRYSSQ